MLKLVEDYDGSDEVVNRGVADIVNASRMIDCDMARAVRSIDASEAGEWFRDRGRESNCIAFLGSKIVGFSFMYDTASYTYLWIAVDPRIGLSMGVKVVEELVEWGLRTRVRKGFRKPLRIGAGLEHGYMYTLLRRVLPSYVEEHSATLMHLEKVWTNAVELRGYRVRRGGVEDYRVIAKIFNEAFSQYPWFRPWDPDYVRRYLENRKPVIFIVETIDGEPAGYIDAEVFEALDRGRSAYIHTLAVKKSHRGRGLGKHLLATMIKELMSLGIEPNRVFLDSVAGLEPLYRKLGFKDIRRYIAFKLCI